MTTESHMNMNTAYNELEQFKNDVLIGLNLPTKELSAKYSYDQTGTGIFNKIIHTNDYYPLNCEADILNEYKDQLVLHFENEPFHLIELSPGEGSNSQILITDFLEAKLSFTYIVIDPAEKFLENVSKEVHSKFPSLKCDTIHADTMHGLKWVHTLSKQRNVLLFLGSNIGSMTTIYLDAFLKQLRRILNSGDYLLLGFDLRKNIERLLEAYNDPNKPYPAFYLNLLARINHELGGHFKLEHFKYLAVYNKDMESINHFLISMTKQTVKIDALKQTFTFDINEPIYLGSAYKYREQQITTLAEENGFEIIKMLTDKNNYFINSLWKINK